MQIQYRLITSEVLGSVRLKLHTELEQPVESCCIEDGVVLRMLLVLKTAHFPPVDVG